MNDCISSLQRLRSLQVSNEFFIGAPSVHLLARVNGDMRAQIRLVQAADLEHRYADNQPTSCEYCETDVPIALNPALSALNVRVPAASFKFCTAIECP